MYLLFDYATNPLYHVNMTYKQTITMTVSGLTPMETDSFKEKFGYKTLFEAYFYIKNTNSETKQKLETFFGKLDLNGIDELFVEL